MKMKRYEKMEGPRPCGRGGFKHRSRPDGRRQAESPPVWAGWI